MIRLTAIFYLVLLLIVVGGCSGSKSNSVTPPDDFILSEIPLYGNDSDSPREFLGSWTMELDPAAKTADITPNRDLNMHFNVKSFLPAPVIIFNSYNPVTQIVDVDLSVHNSSMIDAYDFRLIIYSDSAGHNLENADNWTDLFDIPGGLPVNPFKAYSKYNQKRKFTAQGWFQENFKIKCPGNNFNVQLGMDASYPSNCEEPYEMKDFSMGNLNDMVGSTAVCQVTVHDWQTNTNMVALYCPQITGTSLVNFYQIDTEKWGLELINQTGAAAGTYPGFLLAKASDSGAQALYQKVDIQVKDSTYYGWAKHWGSTVDDNGSELAIDSSRGIVASGVFSGSNVDFDPGTGTTNLTSKGQKDAFVCKYDASGNFKWAKGWGASRDETAKGLAFDSFDSIYVAGRFLGTVDFDPGTGSTVRNPNGAFGTSDIYVSKFTPDGLFTYVKTWGSSGNDDEANDIAADSTGNICITGFFRSSADFNPDSGTDNHSSLGGTDIFLSRLASNGSYLWAKTWGGTADAAIDQGKSVTIDTSSNIYVLGEFSGTVDFNPDAPTENKTAAGNQDIFLSKFDQSGNFIWVKTWGGASTGDEDQGREIVFANSFLFVTGSFGGTVDFDPGTGTVNKTSAGGKDIFLSCLNLNGELMWNQVWGGTSLDEGNALAVSDDGFIYVTGSFYSTNTDFDPGSGSVVISSRGYNDIFISKFDNSGNFQWAQTWGSTQYDEGLGIDTDQPGLIYTTGGFSGTIDFDPSPGMDNHESHGAADAFIVKILPNGRWE
jgi:hypothetical protein